MPQQDWCMYFSRENGIKIKVLSKNGKEAFWQCCFCRLTYFLHACHYCGVLRWNFRCRLLLLKPQHFRTRLPRKRPISLVKWHFPLLQQRGPSSIFSCLQRLQRVFPKVTYFTWNPLFLEIRLALPVFTGQLKMHLFYFLHLGMRMEDGISLVFIGIDLITSILQFSIS